MKDFEDYIYSLQRFSALNLFNSDYSTRNGEYTFDNLDSVLEISLIV